MSCQIFAKVLARSVGQDAPPLTSFQLRYPLQIHAELLTHRMFSRNARSSRAVPTARMIEEVKSAPFIPRYWGANQKGMQATEECNELVDLADDFMLNEEAWLWARDRAVEAAGAFAGAGYQVGISLGTDRPVLGALNGTAIGLVVGSGLGEPVSASW